MTDDNSIATLAFERPKVSRQVYHETVRRALDLAQKKGQYMETVRWLGEQNLFFFAVYILHMTYLDNDWGYALCHEVQRKKYGRMWILSREHYKSTVITIASTIREILMDPETTIAIYSYNQSTAQKLFFNPIKREFDENALLHELYPDVLWGSEKPQDVWQAQQLNVKRNRRSKEFTLACASLFSQLTGSHYDKLIYDDCMTIEGVQTPESIDNACNAWDMSINTGRTDSLQYVIIGTYYSYHELYEYIDKKNVVQLIVQPCVDNEGRGVLWTKDQIVEKRKTMGSASFATQCLCDPKAGSSIGFRKEWLKFWVCSTFAGLNIYIFVDPAGKVQRKRDNTVFWVIGLDAQDNYYVIDLIADKLTLTQRADTLFRLQRTYHPENIFYEEIGLQADIEHIRDRMERTNYRFAITPVNQTMEKGMRMEALIPVFEAGRVYLPEHCWHRNWEGRDEDTIQTFINDEYMAFPHMVHDDRLDDLANIVHPDIAPMLHRPDEYSVERALYDQLKARGTATLPFDRDGGGLDSLDNYEPY